MKMCCEQLIQIKLFVFVTIILKIIFQWMRRFSIFNESCKKIFRMIDKWTYVANRELFFDINPYLNNLQVILRGCSRYLKWVSLEKCQKPINGGPTLAGLMGGFAGT